LKELTNLPAKGKRRDASDLCVNQLKMKKKLGPFVKVAKGIS